MAKKQIFKFGSDSDHLDGVKPAKKYIPKWYKDERAYGYGNLQFHNDFPIKSFKNCMPFLDSLTYGYMIETWCDIAVRYADDGAVHFTWGDAHPTPLSSRNSGDVNRVLPVPFGCSSTEYIWKMPYCFKTPPGYSVLFSHPSNRYDLPFITLNGLIDSDSAVGAGNIPFFLKNDFEGVIEKGTPIVQILPFKRENWKIEKDALTYSEGITNMNKSRSVFFGFYKQNVRKKKEYE